MITVRQAILTDMDKLVLLLDAYRQFEGCATDVAAAREFLLARFNHNGSALFMAFADDDPVGFTQLFPMFSTVSLARTFILNDLFVCERARGRGAAGALMASALEYARTLGAIEVSLVVANTNPVARAVYEATGWKRDEQFQTYFQLL